MKNYIKPQTEIIKTDLDSIMNNSHITQEPCDCYQHRVYGGCEGCPGGGKVGHTCECGCNHWDENSHEIIPG